MSQEKDIPVGRKFKLSLICLLVLLVGFGLSGFNAAFAALYSELITAVLGILFVYSGGNVANKWAVGNPQGATLSIQNSPEK